MLTIAIHRANPTSMRPSRKPALSGRNAHARPSCQALADVSDSRRGIEAYHKERRNNPVHHDTKADLHPYRSFSEGMMQSFKSNLAEDRIHHNQQSNRCAPIISHLSILRIETSCNEKRKRQLTYRHTNSHKFSLLQRRTSVRHKIAKKDADKHGKEDPEC